MRPYISLLAAALLGLSACSGSGGNGERAASSTARITLGTSARSHIVTTAEDALLTRYGYRLNRRVDTEEDVRLETSWKEVSATADELAAGMAFVRVRITVSARPRSRAGGTANTFSARMLVDCQGRANAAYEWTDLAITAERESYIDEIADFLINEFKGGVM